MIRFKKECRQLASDSTLLCGLLEKNKVAIDKLDVAHSLRICLSECLDFVIECQGWSTITVTLEVVLRHRYRKLTDNFEKLIRQLNMEVNVCDRSA